MMMNIKYPIQLAAPRLNITSVAAGAVGLSINAAIPNATKYKIIRSRVGDQTVDLRMFSITSLTATDGTTDNIAYPPLPATQYYYMPIAESNAYGPSFAGQSMNIVTPSGTGASGTLSTPVLTLGSISGGLTFTWPAIANAAGYWYIESNTSDFRSYPQCYYIPTVGGTTTYSVSDTHTGTVYIKLFATTSLYSITGAYTDSAYSNVITATTT